MSIELPSYTIQTETQKQGKYSKYLTPFLMVISLLLGFFASGYFANNTIKTLSIRNEVLEDINTDNQNKIAEQESTLSILRTEKKVKQQAILQLQNDYKQSINSQAELKSEISFYQRLLSPNLENKGLRVFESSIKKKAGNIFDLKIILVQKIERAKEISGKYQLSLIGTEKNKSKTIKLAGNEQIAYKFKYFHNISLSFSLPEGFKPEQLVVKLFPQNKKAKSVEHRVDWHNIIQ